MRADIMGTHWAKAPNDAGFGRLVPGALRGRQRILTVSAPYYDAYLKEWGVDFTAYVEPGPCPWAQERGLA